MKPRVLVVEDDPVSRAFFVEVLSGLPARVDAAAGCAAALACARHHPHALWLVDAHLPDGGAAALLPRLRAARGDLGAVALAHTASRGAAVHAALLAAGFAEVLAKPVGAACLQATVRQRLRTHVREPRVPFPSAPAAPAAGMAGAACDGPWDDAAAVSVLDDVRQVRALRAMLVGELPATVAQVEAAWLAGDAGAVREPLHRLASACAFTGARRLGDAVRTLHADPADPRALVVFRDEAARVVAGRVGL